MRLRHEAHWNFLNLMIMISKHLQSSQSCVTSFSMDLESSWHKEFMMNDKVTSNAQARLLYLFLHESRNFKQNRKIGNVSVFINWHSKHITNFNPFK